MKPDDIITHYKSVENAAANIGVTVGAVYQWLQSGEVPPMRQSDIEVKTGYALLSDFTISRREAERDENGRKDGA